MTHSNGATALLTHIPEHDPARLRRHAVLADDEATRLAGEGFTHLAELRSHDAIVLRYRAISIEAEVTR